MMEAMRASSSAYDVSMTQAISGELDRISRQTSTPLPSGRRTSRMATLGLVGGIRARASATVPASPTTSMSSAGLEERAQARPHHLVVVEEEHSQAHGPHLATWAADRATRSEVSRSGHG